MLAEIQNSVSGLKMDTDFRRAEQLEGFNDLRPAMMQELEARRAAQRDTLPPDDLFHLVKGKQLYEKEQEAKGKRSDRGRKAAKSSSKPSGYGGQRPRGKPPTEHELAEEAWDETEGVDQL